MNIPEVFTRNVKLNLQIKKASFPFNEPARVVQKYEIPSQQIKDLMRIIKLAQPPIDFLLVADIYRHN